MLPDGSTGARDCRYPSRETVPHPQPSPGRADDGDAVSAAAAGGPDVLLPRWLGGTQRAELATAVRRALSGPAVHPVTAIHLEDVLTELHVAAARDAVWPAAAARVRLATGWDDDVLPVRLSAAELAGVLALPELPDGVRGTLGGTATA